MIAPLCVMMIATPDVVGALARLTGKKSAQRIKEFV
jgi:hypothetical protein